MPVSLILTGIFFVRFISVSDFFTPDVLGGSFLEGVVFLCFLCLLNRGLVLAE